MSTRHYEQRAECNGSSAIANSGRTWLPDMLVRIQSLQYNSKPTTAERAAERQKMQEISKLANYVLTANSVSTRRIYNQCTLPLVYIWVRRITESREKKNSKAFRSRDLFATEP